MFGFRKQCNFFTRFVVSWKTADVSWEGTVENFSQFSKPNRNIGTISRLYNPVKVLNVFSLFTSAIWRLAGYWSPTIVWPWKRVAWWKASEPNLRTKFDGCCDHRLVITRCKIIFLYVLLVLLTRRSSMSLFLQVKMELLMARAFNGGRGSGTRLSIIPDPTLSSWWIQPESWSRTWLSWTPRSGPSIPCIAGSLLTQN